MEKQVAIESPRFFAWLLVIHFKHTILPPHEQLRSILLTFSRNPSIAENIYFHESLKGSFDYSRNQFPTPSPGTLNNHERRSNVRQRTTFAQNENFAADTLLTLFPATFASLLAHDVERNINGLCADNGCQEKQDNTRIDHPELSIAT